MNKDIAFNADDLMQAVTDIRDHVTGKRKLTMRTYTVDVPRIEKINPIFGVFER